MEKGYGLTSLTQELSKIGKTKKNGKSLEERVALLEKQIKKIQKEGVIMKKKAKKKKKR